MTPQEEEFELLRKDYILQTMSHLKAVEEITLHQYKDTMIRAELAIKQSMSSAAFFAFSKFIVKATGE